MQTHFEILFYLSDFSLTIRTSQFPPHRLPRTPLLITKIATPPIHERVSNFLASFHEYIPRILAPAYIRVYTYSITCVRADYRHMRARLPAGGGGVGGGGDGARVSAAGGKSG